MIGRTVGNYVVRSELGHGGMGAVYLAEHTRLPRKVAVKVLLPQLGQDPLLVARFFNEAKAATEIKNEHIVEVLDFGELPDGASYLVMEHLVGVTLQRLMSDEPRLSLSRIAHIVSGIAEALTAAHSHGIVHRDLKPDNVFLVQRGDDADFVKVLDFGIAKLGEGSGAQTKTGAILGTPFYMSPEQCRGGQVDARADVYALGVIVFQLVTGRLPFTQDQVGQLLVAHLTAPPPAPRSLDARIPEDVEAVVLKALEKEPGRRQASALELAQALSAAAARSPNSLARAPATSGGHDTATPGALVARELATPMGLSGSALAGHDTAVPRSGPSALGTPAAPAAPAASAGKQVSASQTLGELFIRVGLRGRQPLWIGVAVGLALVGLSGALALRRSPEHWALVNSTCPQGAMPLLVEIERTGNRVVTRAPGLPDSFGTIEPDGRFTVGNALGTCVGRGDGTTSTETCTNPKGFSCRATYRRAD